MTATNLPGRKTPAHRPDDDSGYSENNPCDREDARQPAPDDAENPEEGGLDHEPDPDT